MTEPASCAPDGDVTTGARILVVDDEPRALADLVRLLRAAPGVGDVRSAGDGDAALRQASDAAFDAVFLDVRMPGLNGVELARVLRRFSPTPELVFVSAHDEAAVDAFELRALDYLRKPVARGRVLEAVARVRLARGIAQAPVGTTEAPIPGSEATAGRRDGEMIVGDEIVAVSAPRGTTTRLLRRSDVRYASSHGDFVRVVTADGRYLMRTTLSEVQERWEPHGFLRVHRQYVVNLHKAVELRPQLGGTAELSFADGSTVPVARRHAAELARRLGV